MRYRVILAGLLVAATSYAADIRLEAGTVSANHSVVVAVHLTPAEDALAGVQFDLEYDTLALNVTVEAGPAAVSAGKVVQTAMLGASKQRVLVIGFNRNNMADGVVALLHVTANAAATTSAALDIRLTAPAGSDGKGKNVVIAGTDAVLSVPVGAGGGSQAGSIGFAAAPSGVQSFTVNVPANAASLAVGNGTGATGQAVEIPIQLTSTGTASPAGMQLDLSFDTTKLAFTSARIGPQSTSAGKGLSQNTLGNGNERLLIAGFNQNTISNGVVAYATFTLGPQFTSGTSLITPLNCAATDGSGNLLATPCLAGTFSVTQGSQAITFGPLSNVAVGTAPFSLSANASSGLAVSFTSNTPTVCTVSGSMVTILISGGCSITATQPGNSTYAPATATQSFTVLFSDVSPSDIFYNDVAAFAQYGITSGCGNNDFCPTANVTRDEMAIFIVRAVYGSDNFTYTATPYFTDVTPSTFGFQWIQKLKDLGITSGCTATTYCPGEVVTRDQMAIFIIRARLGVSIAGPAPMFTYPSTPYFTDATAANEFAFQWIQRMKLENITSGCTTTTYCSTDPVTREEMATFIMRGAFNQFLPAGTPVLTQISPATLPVGTAGTYTITGANTNFVQGTTQLSPIPGVTIGAITVNSPTSMTVQLTASSNAVAQPYSILAITGTEQDVLPNGLVLQ